MLESITSKNPRITETDIVGFESRHRVHLPKSYKDFMLANNGGKPAQAVFPISGFKEEDFDKINAFYGLSAAVESSDIDKAIAALPSSVPHGIIPVAYTSTGDKLVIDLRKDGGPVLFWDFHAFWGNNIWKERLLYPVADNFEALLASLVTDEEAGLTA